MVAACHHYVLSAAAATANTLVLDFDIPGPIVNDRDLFWAPIHYWLMTATVSYMILLLRCRIVSMYCPITGSSRIGSCGRWHLKKENKAC